jgi:hypothetical protein
MCRLRKVQRILAGIFDGLAYTSLGCRRGGWLAWIVAGFGRHDDDASTEEKRAAR